MKLITTEEWDPGFWKQIEPVYRSGFPEHGRKPAAVIRRILERKLGALHAFFDADRRAAAMALTGNLGSINAMLIDYLTVRPDLRKRGVGRSFLGSLEDWAKTRGRDGIVIEAEAEPTSENESRIRFWEGAGFETTDYVHRYIWVPEPYLALFREWNPTVSFPRDGRKLFDAITDFHGKAYRK